MTDSLADEHRRLLEEMERLQKEHAALAEHPDDVDAHRAHREKLRSQIMQLREHIARIQREMP